MQCKLSLVEWYLFTGLEENGYFSYEGSLTTPPCTTDVRWYIMKTLGCISERQLEKFRSVKGADRNGNTYPLHDIFRPIQEHNYTARPIHECGEMRQEPMVGQCLKQELNEAEEDYETWFIIGIVFVVLFGCVATLSIVVLLFLN